MIPRRFLDEVKLWVWVWGSRKNSQFGTWPSELREMSWRDQRLCRFWSWGRFPVRWHRRLWKIGGVANASLEWSFTVRELILIAVWTNSEGSIGDLECSPVHREHLGFMNSLISFSVDWNSESHIIQLNHSSNKPSDLTASEAKTGFGHISIRDPLLTGLHIEVVHVFVPRCEDLSGEVFLIQNIFPVLRRHSHRFSVQRENTVFPVWIAFRWGE